jgi:hypothetical protein
MPGTWPVDALAVPAHLPAERAWRWCLMRTLRDVRLARRRGGWISCSMAERLFNRRWVRCHRMGSAAFVRAMERAGRRRVRSYWRHP